MTLLRHIAFLFCVAAVCGGCFSTEPPPSDLGSATQAACGRRLAPRTVELLEELARIRLGRERQALRLAAAGRTDYSGSTAENDPRFNWLLEAELCPLMLFSSRKGETPEEYMEPAVREMLLFEQRVLWAKFASLRPRPADDRERRECVLALELATGWAPERIEGFDFTSLPVPEAGKRTAALYGANISAVLRTAAELLLLDPQGTPPDRKLLAAKMDELSLGRKALALHYLREAEKAYAAAPGAENLEKWRIADARYIFENSIPRCMCGDKWDLN